MGKPCKSLLTTIHDQGCFRWVLDVWTDRSDWARRVDARNWLRKTLDHIFDVVCCNVALFEKASPNALFMELKKFQSFERSSVYTWTNLKFLPPDRTGFRHAKLYKLQKIWGAEPRSISVPSFYRSPVILKGGSSGYSVRSMPRMTCHGSGILGGRGRRGGCSRGVKAGSIAGT